MNSLKTGAGFLVVVASLLGGCATQTFNETPVALSPEHIQSGIQSTKVVVRSSVNKSYDMQEAQAGGNAQLGIIGILVQTAILSSMNSSRQEEAKHHVKAKSALLAYNFGSSFRRSIKSEISKLNWLNVKSVVKTHQPPGHSVDGLLEETSDDALMVIDSVYSLSKDNSKIIVKTNVALYPKMPPIEKPSVADETRFGSLDVIYRNTFTSERPLKEFTNPGQAIRIWTADNNKRLSDELENAISEIAAKIRLDIEKVS